jgi:hypothetical protein
MGGVTIRRLTFGFGGRRVRFDTAGWVRLCQQYWQ